MAIWLTWMEQYYGFQSIQTVDSLVLQKGIVERGLEKVVCKKNHWGRLLSTSILLSSDRTATAT
jgi:hypothetical protein